MTALQGLEAPGGTTPIGKLVAPACERYATTLRGLHWRGALRAWRGRQSGDTGLQQRGQYQSSVHPVTRLTRCANTDELWKQGKLYKNV